MALGQQAKTGLKRHQGSPRCIIRGMSREFQVFVAYDPAEQAWVPYVPALDHLSTFGPTRDEALANTREAVLGYLEAVELEGIELTIEPTPAELIQIAV